MQWLQKATVKKCWLKPDGTKGVEVEATDIYFECEVGNN